MACIFMDLCLVLVIAWRFHEGLDYKCYVKVREHGAQTEGTDLCGGRGPPRRPSALSTLRPYQDIFSIPSLMDFLLTNTDAGHIKTLAVKAADFAMKLSTTDWQMSSSHVASCTNEGTCDQLLSDNCNDHADVCWLD